MMLSFRGLLSESVCPAGAGSPSILLATQQSDFFVGCLQLYFQPSIEQLGAGTGLGHGYGLVAVRYEIEDIVTRLCNTIATVFIQICVSYGKTEVAATVQKME